MKECPACGQTLPPDPPLGLGFRGKQAQIVEMVYKAGPHGIASDRLFDALHKHDPNGGPMGGLNVLHVQVNQINKRLRTIGKAIRAKQRGSPGGPSSYSLLDVERSRT